MTRYRRRKTNRGYTAIGKRTKIKNRKRDLDEIHVDMGPKNSESLLNQEIQFDTPGAAQFYCLHCARYFIDNQAMTEHFRSKTHKRRLKSLETDPYSQEEAEAAAGMGNFYPAKKNKVETQPPKDISDTTDEITTKC